MVDVTDSAFAPTIHIGLVTVLDLVVTAGLLTNAPTGTIDADTAQAISGFTTAFSHFAARAIATSPAVEICLRTVEYTIVAARNLAETVLADAALTIGTVVAAAGVLAGITVLTAAVGI